MQSVDTELTNHLRDQLRATWEQVPAEEKSTVLLDLMESMTENERLSFQEAFFTKWPTTSANIPANFALMMITPDDLKQINLDEEEIERFNKEELRELSFNIRHHYVVQGFWEELKYHTAHFLGESRNKFDHT